MRGHYRDTRAAYAQAKADYYAALVRAKNKVSEYPTKYSDSIEIINFFPFEGLPKSKRELWIRELASRIIERVPEQQLREVLGVYNLKFDTSEYFSAIIEHAPLGWLENIFEINETVDPCNQLDTIILRVDFIAKKINR